MTPTHCPRCGGGRILDGPFYAPDDWRCLDCGKRPDPAGYTRTTRQRLRETVDALDYFG